jgi:hypothetical protein
VRSQAKARMQAVVATPRTAPLRRNHLALTA